MRSILKYGAGTRLDGRRFAAIVLACGLSVLDDVFQSDKHERIQIRSDCRDAQPSPASTTAYVDRRNVGVARVRAAATTAWFEKAVMEEARRPGGDGRMSPDVKDVGPDGCNAVLDVVPREAQPRAWLAVCVGGVVCG